MHSPLTDTMKFINTSLSGGKVWASRCTISCENEVQAKIARMISPNSEVVLNETDLSNYDILYVEHYEDIAKFKNRSCKIICLSEKRFNFTNEFTVKPEAIELVKGNKLRIIEMPDNNANRRKINSSLDMLRKQVDDLYTSTYYTRDSSEELKTQVTDRLDDAIRKSTQGDDEFQNISNTSKLFRRLLKPDGSSASNKLAKNFGNGGDDDISNLFQSPNIVASIMDSYSSLEVSH